MDNFAEFAAIKILFGLFISLAVDLLQVLGDSKLTTDCLKLSKPPWDIFLLPIYEDIERVSHHFQLLSFQHIYREINFAADSLSKKGLLLSDGFMDSWELSDGSMVFLDHHQL